MKDKQRNAMILAGVLGLIMLGGIIFLGSEFKNINKQGLSCLKGPLYYAENRLFEETGEDYVCDCSKDQLVNELNLSFKFS